MIASPCALAAPAAFGAPVWAALGILAVAASCERAGVAPEAVWAAMRGVGEALPCPKCRDHFLNQGGWNDGDPLKFLVEAHNASRPDGMRLTEKEFVRRYVARRDPHAAGRAALLGLGLLAGAFAFVL